MTHLTNCESHADQEEWLPSGVSLSDHWVGIMLSYRQRNWANNGAKTSLKTVISRPNPSVRVALHFRSCRTIKRGIESNTGLQNFFEKKRIVESYIMPGDQCRIYGLDRLSHWILIKPKRDLGVPNIIREEAVLYSFLHYIFVRRIFSLDTRQSTSQELPLLMPCSLYKARKLDYVYEPCFLSYRTNNQL